MRKILEIFAVAVFLFVTATFAFSQERINFKRGAKEAFVTGSLSGYKSKRVFVIRVRRGQTLSTEQIKSGSSNRYVTVSVTAPNGETAGDSDASCNNRKEIAPTMAGVYRVEVYECRKADAWRGNFRLKVRVE
jgi:hypothetical protein